MDDRELLQLFRERAEKVFDLLARRFGRRLHLTAMNILDCEQDAEECVNDTYLSLWNAIPPAAPEPLTPYVLRTGKNIALNRLRARNTQKRGGYMLSLEELAGTVPAPEQDAQLGKALNQWLSTLSKRDRIIFLRRHWFGDGVKDIAKALGTTENAVSLRLHRLKQQLKTYLIQEGYYE